jgi:tRNA (mo5U34)-methyltransferase
MDRAEIRRLVESVPHWHHTFQFSGGVSTDGGYDPRGLLEQIELPDLTGLRVLDVRTRDGFFAFACERAGAREVVALDHVDPDVTGFEVARRILGSKVEYARENIYQSSREKYGSFDLIFFLGVLYHLRDPLLALDRLSSVCDGRMVVESLVCDTRFFTGFEQTTTLEEIAPALASIPIAQFLPAGRFHIDATNQWVPNLTGLTHSSRMRAFSFNDRRFATIVAWFTQRSRTIRRRCASSRWTAGCATLPRFVD